MTVYKLFYTTGGVWWHQQYEWSIRLPLNTVWKKWVILLRTPNKNILFLVIKCEIILHHFCKLITTGRKNSHRCYIRMERLSNWIPSGFVNVASRNLPSLEMQQERREWNNQSEQNPHDEFSKSCDYPNHAVFQLLSLILFADDICFVHQFLEKSWFIMNLDKTRSYMSFGKPTWSTLTSFWKDANHTNPQIVESSGKFWSTKVDSITLQPLWNPHELPLVPMGWKSTAGVGGEFFAP